MCSPIVRTYWPSNETSTSRPSVTCEMTQAVFVTLLFMLTSLRDYQRTIHSWTVCNFHLKKGFRSFLHYETGELFIKFPDYCYFLSDRISSPVLLTTPFSLKSRPPIQPSKFEEESVFLVHIIGIRHIIEYAIDPTDRHLTYPASYNMPPTLFTFNILVKMIL